VLGQNVGNNSAIPAARIEGRALRAAGWAMDADGFFMDTASGLPCGELGAAATDQDDHTRGLVAYGVTMTSLFGGAQHCILSL
jgi:hypothetical protein